MEFKFMFNDKCVFKHILTLKIMVIFFVRGVF